MECAHFNPSMAIPMDAMSFHCLTSDEFFML